MPQVAKVSAISPRKTWMTRLCLWTKSNMARARFYSIPHSIPGAKMSQGERQCRAQAPHPAMKSRSPARDPPGKGKPLRGYWLAIAGIAVVVAVAVVAASLRMTEGAIDRAVAEREAADRFLANELAVLRIMAMSSDSPVPARLYLGIEECFGKSVAIPFDRRRGRPAHPSPPARR